MFLKKSGEVICFPSQNEIVFWFLFAIFKWISGTVKVWKPDYNTILYYWYWLKYIWLRTAKHTPSAQWQGRRSGMKSKPYSSVLIYLKILLENKSLKILIERNISVSNKTTLRQSKFRMSSITSFGRKLFNAFIRKKIASTDFHIS